MKIIVSALMIAVSCLPMKVTKNEMVYDSSIQVASELLNSISPTLKNDFHRAFDDTRRTTWDRIPKIREGLKIDKLSKVQKSVLHRLLQKCLSREGYLMAISIMFNEDIQQQFEPDLGKNEYWIELFGNPQQGAYWSWQLEGHHLSLNFTFYGNTMISHTPFLIGSNPQVTNSDQDRNGLNFLYEEETIAGALVNSFNPHQRSQGYSMEEQPNNVYGEIYRNELKAPDEGIRISKLNANQLDLLRDLIASYQAYFSDSYISSTSHNIEYANTKFFFMGETKYNGKHYYRLKNEVEMIECENYGGHTHHLWRNENDFGLAILEN